MVREQIRVLVVDDHAIFRDGLCALIKEQEDMLALDAAADGLEGLEKALELDPDVVLMDINMPCMDGVEATRRMTLARPEARVIILTIYGDDDHVFQAIRAGASGYVLKDARSQDLLEAIRVVHRGDVIIEPYIASRVLREFRRLSEGESKDQFVELASQERAILELVGQGKTNREIGNELYMAEQTVKNKLSLIYQKLKVNNRAEAMRRAMQEGIISDRAAG